MYKEGKEVFHMEELFIRDMDEEKDCTSGIQGLGAIQCVKGHQGH